MRAVDHTTNDRQAIIAVVPIDTSKIKQNNSNNKLSKRGITGILTKRCFQHSRACLEVCGSDQLGRSPGASLKEAGVLNSTLPELQPGLLFRNLN